MSDHPSNDYLSRSLARRQIDGNQYEAGRRWQALHQAAKAGNEQAKNILDALHLRPSLHELLRDVLSGPGDEAGLAGPLAQAAAKRGLNPVTGSRNMKALALKLRKSLHLLSIEFERADANPPTPAEMRKFYLNRATYLGGVSVSSPQTDELEREIAHVQSLAFARGLRVVPGFDENTFTLVTFGGHSLIVILRGIEVDSPDLSLHEIEAVLKGTPLKFKSAPKRKRGARGAAPVTLAKHA